MTKARIPAGEELALIRGCLAIEETSPSGLVWLVSIPSIGIEPGDAAFTTKDRGGYYCGVLARIRLLAHRVVFFLHNSYWPGGPIDHIDGCRNNNAPDNLREVTHAVNNANVRAKGYSATGRGTFKAEVWKGGKRYRKNFPDELSARKWYLEMKDKLYPELAGQWQWIANEEDAAA
ncbi:TPA: HNH endonuclease [Escherichia coli]|nr:HNH endonuclease [Escherichia coli]HCQ4512225.1 HNH endonuclease [Escherichia coli]HCQ4516725.1 HNH endonuclease [Escherichia coli]HCQ4525842.1 HNH endonuclease [Escherichia coli]HCQ4530361.1 HNH endonuclease [Escherichia coli]